MFEWIISSWYVTSTSSFRIRWKVIRFCPWKFPKMVDSFHFKRWVEQSTHCFVSLGQQFIWIYEIERYINSLNWLCIISWYIDSDSNYFFGIFKLFLVFQNKMEKKMPHCRNNSKIKYKNRRKRQNRYILHTNTWPLTHKYMTSLFRGLIQALH